MTDAIDHSTGDSLDDSYRASFGSVPKSIENRQLVLAAVGRAHTAALIETLRQTLLFDGNELGARVQQLVHVGQLLVLGREEPARLHTQGALHAGATLADLVGVAESALITGGMPAYALGMEIVFELLDTDAAPADGSSSPERCQS
jgi:4-carboxymuconolactone decarboxylase